MKLLQVHEKLSVFLMSAFIGFGYRQIENGQKRQEFSFGAKLFHKYDLDSPREETIRTFGS